MSIKKIIIVFILFITTSYSTFANYEEEEPQGTESYPVNKAGTYFIEIGTDTEHTEESRVHIRFPNTNLSYENMEGIDAHDLIYKVGTFDAKNTTEIIKKAKAHAWNMEDGSRNLNINVKVSKVEDKTGPINTVTFSTDKGTSVTVDVFEQSEIFLDLDNIYVNESNIETAQFRKLSKLVILLIIIPVIIFIILLKVIDNKSKEIQDLLSKSNTKN